MDEEVGIKNERVDAFSPRTGTGRAEAGLQRRIENAKKALSALNEFCVMLTSGLRSMRKQ